MRLITSEGGGRRNINTSVMNDAVNAKDEFIIRARIVRDVDNNIREARIARVDIDGFCGLTGDGTQDAHAGRIAECSRNGISENIYAIDGDIIDGGRIDF
jgi:hypothetical protein